jgi:hypothetical protein
MAVDYDGLKHMLDKSGTEIEIGMEVAHIYKNGNYDAKGIVEFNKVEGKVLRVTSLWNKYKKDWQTVEKRWKHHFKIGNIYEIINSPQKSLMERWGYMDEKSSE